MQQGGIRHWHGQTHSDLGITCRAPYLLTHVAAHAEVRVYWHPQGDYVAVQVDRFTKTRKSTYTSFELFSVKDKDIPMEVLEMPNKTDKVVDFAWEPKVQPQLM